jgi:alpha-glucosidase
VRTTWPPLPGFPADFQPSASDTSENVVTPLSASRRSISATSANATGNMTGLAGRTLNTPPYALNNSLGPLYTGSIWPDLVGYGGYVSYDTHNIFASGMIAHTREGLLKRRPNERPFIITRSTFAGDGRKTGHWTGDNGSEWAQYLISIWQNMEFASIFQIPTVGADVCGFNLNTTENLCARWAMLGAWYPFYRNHAADNSIFQEFYRWPLVTEAAQKAIRTRFALIDYFYTSFTQQTIDGSPTTIIPLFYEYPNDVATYNISYQFFFGPSVLVSPVTVENSTSVDLYLPEDIFYDYWTGQQVNGTGSTITLDNITYTDIPVHIRGGSIIPRRLNTDAVNTTTQLRDQDFEFVIAPDADGKATGNLFLDDGLSLNSESSMLGVSFDNGHLAVTGSFGYSVDVQVVSATVLGQGNGTSYGESYSLNRTLNAAWSTNLYGH